MGFLALGTPLEWNEAKKYADHIKEHGVAQFLHIWDQLKDRSGDSLLWGDEVFYSLIWVSCPTNASTDRIYGCCL